jgi:hypothetical protein
MPVTSLSGARDKYKDKIKLINDIQDALEEIKGNKKWVEITDIDLAKKNLTRKDLLWFTANRNINMIDKSQDQKVINIIHKRITK